MPSRDYLPRDFFDLPADDDDDALVGRGPNILLDDRARLLVARRLSQPVGERQPNDPEDVAQVESLVRATGGLDFRPDSEPTGLFSAPLRDAIRGFQRRNDLLDDGIVNPDGETFAGLRREIGFEDTGLPGDAEEDASGAALDGMAETAGASDPECARLANAVRNTSINLENWLRAKEGDEARVRLAEQRVEEARAALAAASAAAAVRVPGGAAGLLGGIAGLGTAAANLTTAENELELERGRLEITLRNVQRAEATKRDAEAAFDDRCGS